jgi:hemerythrin
LPQEWNDSWSTGVPELDAQHRELYRLANDLTASVHRGEGTRVIEKTVDSLLEYAASHFRREEACMDQYRCPAALQNRKAHAAVTERLLVARERIRREGPTPAIVLQIQQELLLWLGHHIGKVDAQLAPCVRRRAA